MDILGLVTTTKNSTAIDYNFFPYIEGEKIILAFDLLDDNFITLIEIIKRWCLTSSIVFDFITYSNDLVANGDGATRQVYQKTITDLLSFNILTIDGVFYKFNEQHDFWTPEENCKGFAKFIELCVKSGCVFPYHFPVEFLQSLRESPMNEPSLMYFIEKKDETIHKNILRMIKPCLKHEEREKYVLDLGYESYMNFLWNALSPSPNKEFYSKITCHMSLFKKRKFNPLPHPSYHCGKYFLCHVLELKPEMYPSVETMDYVLSGVYEIRNPDVLAMCVFSASIIKKHDLDMDTGTSTDEKIIEVPDPLSDNYFKLWSEFVLELSPNELKGLLMLFTNSLSLRNKIYIKSKNVLRDLTISTCYADVIISNKLFTSLETLRNLKIYFGSFAHTNSQPDIIYDNILSEDSMDPQNTQSMDPQNTQSMDPQNTLSMDPQNTLSMDPQNTLSMDPQERHANVIQTVVVTSNQELLRIISQSFLPTNSVTNNVELENNAAAIVNTLNLIFCFENMNFD
jgi:hypothetical protein